jgi:hypothetical protein
MPGLSAFSLNGLNNHDVGTGPVITDPTWHRLVHEEESSPTPETDEQAYAVIRQEDVEEDAQDRSY